MTMMPEQRYICNDRLIPAQPNNRNDEVQVKKSSSSQLCVTKLPSCGVSRSLNEGFICETNACSDNEELVNR